MASTFYEVLGVSRFASDADIKKAFKTLAKKYHPDKHPGEKFYEEHFKKINEAHQTLSNPKSRQRYDLLLNYNLHTPPPRQQYKQPTNQQHSSPKPPPYTNYKKPQASRSAAAQKKLNRYYIYIGIGAFVFILACAWFYNFMNIYASEEYYAEGLREELKGNDVEAMGYYFSSLEKDLNNPTVNEKVGDLYRKESNRASSIESYFYSFDTERNAKESQPQENVYDLFSHIDSLAFLYYNRAYENYESPADKRKVGFKMIKCCIKMGKYEQASQKLSGIAELPNVPKDDSILYYRGDINFYLNNYSEALKDYRSFNDLHPNSSESAVKIALCYYNQNDAMNKMNALVQLTMTIEKFPHKGEAYYFLGEINIRDKDMASACYNFYKADSLNVRAAKGSIYKYCEN